MRNSFRVLQANLRKSTETQMSLLNDDQLQDFDLLMIQEPHCRQNEGRAIVAPIHHNYWTQYHPTVTDSGGQWPFRSMIWARNGLRIRQLNAPSADVTALLIETDEHEILAASVYIPARQNGEDAALMERLEFLNGTIREAQSQTAPRQVEVLIVGDFNRHDQFWGGDRVAPASARGEGSPIVDFMADHGLQSLLLRGTITFENSGGCQSTIDLTLASTSLVQASTRCDVYPQEHGSDHRAIETHFDLGQPRPSFQSRPLFRQAPWGLVREEISKQL